MPRNIWPLGVAGLIPFFASAAAAVLSSDLQPVALYALMGYGAIILSFLGGTWWGRLFAETEDTEAWRPGPIMAVMPSIWAWFAFLIYQIARTEGGLLVMATGFLVVLVIDLQLVKTGYWPKAYGTLRQVLSFGAVIALGTGLYMII